MFTISELFGEDPANHLETKGAVCVQCGALVAALGIHTEWHNYLEEQL